KRSKQSRLFSAPENNEMSGGLTSAARAAASNRALWVGSPQPSLGRLVTTKRGLSPLGKISAFPITRRALLQLCRVEYSNSVKLRHGLCSLPSFIWALRLSKAPFSSWLSRSLRA